MAKKHPRFSDEIRAALENCGKTRYRITQETGIDKAVLCRFVKGQVGLSMETLDTLAENLGLHVVVDEKRKKGKA